MAPLRKPKHAGRIVEKLLKKSAEPRQSASAKVALAKMKKSPASSAAKPKYQAKHSPMASPSNFTCPKCQSGYIFPILVKAVVGTWMTVSHSWQCMECLHEWPASEEDEQQKLTGEG